MVVVHVVLSSSSSSKRKKGRYSSSWKPQLRATVRHLPYGITQCLLPATGHKWTCPA